MIKKLQFLQLGLIQFLASFLALSPDHELSLLLADTKVEIKNLSKSVSYLIQIKIKEVANRFVCKASFFKNKKIPVFIANFVLVEYGLGAIFGCPAHDQRDLDFAVKYKLDVIPVVKPKMEIIILK